MHVTEFSVVSGIGDLPAPSNAAKQFIDAWVAARRGNLVPRKPDFDPLTVFPLLPDLWICHYEREEDAFRCQLAGENIIRAWGSSIVGKLSQDILGAQDNAEVVAVWKKVLDVPLIHYAKLEQVSENMLYAAERTVVPLSDAADDRTYILGLSRYSLAGPLRAEPPKIPKTAFHIPCRDL